MSTGGSQPNTLAPQSPGDLFAIHKEFEGALDAVNALQVPAVSKQAVVQALEAEVDAIEAAIVAEIQAQQQKGSLPPGGLVYEGTNYTVSGGKLIVETIPDASTLTLVTSPFGGNTPPASGNLIRMLKARRKG